jgi:iron complex outermembrane recepter protein
MSYSSSPALRNWIAAVLATSAVSSTLAAERNVGTDFETVNEVVVTGTRVADRSRFDTLAPVDIVSAENLAKQGNTELAQALSTAIPSINFPRPAISDGTDSIRPATLRGLAPDQTLVLVNSKRRHQTALVNVNNTIGRGSAAVDLNAIPLAAIERVEVLRDGASAQYGSDAIAGVVNIQLREAREGGEASLTFGTYETDVETAGGDRSESDGDTLTASIWNGFGVGDTGFLTLSAEYRDRDPTSRGDVDTRPGAALLGSVPSRYGDPDIEDATFYLNTGVPINDKAQVYGWVGYQQRDGEAAAFPRLANDAQGRVSPLLPNGFLPIITTEVDDLALGIGTRGTVGKWDFDVATVYGLNEIDYGVQNTANVSLGAMSPTSFDAGGLEYDQVTFNAGLVRLFEVGASKIPLNVALGVEARRETYTINAGQPESFIQGGVPTLQGNPPMLNTAPPGAQGFPGFRITDQRDEDREAYGAYVDLEAQLTDKFLASAAARVEDYSDFGSALTGKVSGRYNFTENFGVRSTVSTGFKAPGLQQAFFTSVQTSFIGGIPFEIGTFAADSAPAMALGAQELEEEESVNYSLGFVVRAGNFEATVDAYRIDIDDRIVLSENLNTGAVPSPDITPILAPLGVRGGRFFLNGVDTETEGVDVVLRQKFAAGSAGSIDLSVFANYNNTDVTKVPQAVASLTSRPVLFGRINVNTFEDGTPDVKAGLIGDWSKQVRFGSIGANLKATYYGEVIEPTAPTTVNGVTMMDIDLGEHVLVDLSLRAKVGEKVNITFGVDNLTDEYPDKTAAGLNPQAALAYSRYSPFGFNGRFLYGRASFSW